MPSFATLWQSRWLVLVASLWLQTCAGIGYAFGGYSPLVKSTLGYSQQQITILGIAKDLGPNIGLMAGALSGVLPTWCLIIVGTVHNLVGYGWLWLIVTGHSAALPCGRSVFLSLSVPMIYITFFAPDQAAYLLIIAVGPTVVSLLTMFFIRRVKSKEEGKQSDVIGFSFIYGDSMVMAAYLMAVLIWQDVMTVSFNVRLAITVLLLAMVALPLVTPMLLWFVERRKRMRDAERGHQVYKEEGGIKAPLLNVQVKEGRENSRTNERVEASTSHEDQGAMGYYASKNLDGWGSGEFKSQTRDGNFTGVEATSDLEGLHKLSEEDRKEGQSKIMRITAAEGAVPVTTRNDP
ncbi:hypothetical protein GOP47_0019414 [Adiantum capillus-veneris]|uniref:Nodulin-like domain-containing protein n=1 Tax=Adiantum capillus-veneris TaxID=13818 RepID=A0A9D4Z7T6_ADICA|nr:hypothetical protein GOP47_0019414 [Adiantum capillus-veneris]